MTKVGFNIRFDLNNVMLPILMKERSTMCRCETNPFTQRRSRAFTAISMSCLALAVLWQNTSFAHGSHPDLKDFFHGLLYGLSFGFSIAALIVSRRTGRRDSSHSFQH